MEEELGSVMYCHAYSLQGHMSVMAWKDFLEGLIQAIGMKRAGQEALWNYPLDNGAGGNGFTIVIPMTDSFIAVDSWPDRGGAYLSINSCKSFSPNVFADFLKTWEGIHILEAASHTLRIV